ncbi:hypothetical protein T02_726 [Trichinella nativa]|uniref:Uncharacterized protein n=1 Tax=Trichinella nativa TaxID=6335 RepID=A0A0V1LM84_9BILA|nr:hypothetical protein T02_726 [Trichinella nativa]
MKCLSSALSVVSSGLSVEFQKVGGWFVENDWKETNCDGTIVLIIVEKIITDNRKVAKKFYAYRQCYVLMSFVKKMEYICLLMSKELELKKMVTEMMEINDSLSYELNRRVSSTPFKDQKQEKLDGYYGKVEMACKRLAAPVFSSTPEMDERNAADMKALS